MSRRWKYFASLTKINRDVQLHYSIPVTLKGFINRLTVYELWYNKKTKHFSKNIRVDELEFSVKSA